MPQAGMLIVPEVIRRERLVGALGSSVGRS